MRKKEPWIPARMRLPLLLALVFNTLVYNGSRLVTRSRVHHDLSCALDAGIPFVPWTVVIYLGCYLFWAVNYVIGCRGEEGAAYRFLSADFLAKAVCLVCFVLFPTTNVRPAILGNTIWHDLMRLVYRLDAADNLFPSIHCLTSWFCYIAVRRNTAVPGWYRRLSLAFAVLVFLSTLTTKQHVVLDVAGGALLAEWSYSFAEKSGFSAWYKKMISALRRMWFHKS